MIYIHERTPNFMKRPLPTFKKITLLWPIFYSVSFFSLSRLKSSIPLFLQNCINILEILTENSTPQGKCKTYMPQS